MIQQKNTLSKDQNTKFIDVKNQVNATLKNLNMFVSEEERNSYVKKQKNDFIKKWDSEKRLLLGFELAKAYDDILKIQSKSYYLENIPRLFTFGYSLGFQLSEMLGGKKDENEESGILSALFNIYASLFDKICDNHSNLYRRLVEIVNHNSLSKAMTLGNQNKEYFITSKEDHILLKIVCRLMTEYFKRSINHLENNYESSLFIEFQKTIFASYQSEIESSNQKLETTIISNGIHQLLFQKSVLPSWLICLTSIICIKDKPKFDFKQFKENIMKVGKSIWIADDMADIEEDLNNHQWNYILLQLCTQNNISIIHDNGILRSRNEIFEDLILTDTIQHAIIELCKSFKDGILGIKEQNFAVNQFEYNLLVWLNKWLNKFYKIN